MPLSKYYLKAQQIAASVLILTSLSACTQDAQSKSNEPSNSAPALGAIPSTVTRLNVHDELDYDGTLPKEFNYKKVSYPFVSPHVDTKGAHGIPVAQSESHLKEQPIRTSFSRTEHSSESSSGQQSSNAIVPIGTWMCDLEPTYDDVDGHDIVVYELHNDGTFNKKAPWLEINGTYKIDDLAIEFLANGMRNEGESSSQVASFKWVEEITEYSQSRMNLNAPHPDSGNYRISECTLHSELTETEPSISVALPTNTNPAGHVATHGNRPWTAESVHKDINTGDTEYARSADTISIDGTTSGQLTLSCIPDGKWPNVSIFMSISRADNTFTRGVFFNKGMSIRVDSEELISFPKLSRQDERWGQWSANGDYWHFGVRVRKDTAKFRKLITQLKSGEELTILGSSDSAFSSKHEPIPFTYILSLNGSSKAIGAMLHSCGIF